MAISCFTGKPGNGKTLTMMHFLCEDLLRTERYVVTNIPVKMGELAEYLQNEAERRKLRCPDLRKRFLQISVTDALMFWRYRSGGLILDKWDGKVDGKLLDEESLLRESENYFKKVGEKKEWSLPISYYISEAHRYFNAKRFQRIAITAELYVTHHRHLHDEVYFDTQFPKQLAVAARELTEEWHVLRNDYHRVIGLVKMIPRIRMASYYDMPQGSSQKPFARRSIHIRENGVAGCYESTGALGSIERAMDTEQKKPKRGIDLRLFILLVVGAIVVGLVIMAKGPSFVFRKISESNQIEARAVASAGYVGGGGSSAVEVLAEAPPAPPAPTVVRVFSFRGRIEVGLSDGSTWYSPDVERYVRKNYVQIQGERYFFR